MSVFQSFQTGLALGQQQRKERDASQARASASELFKAGNYEGAETGLMTAGLYDEAQAFGSAGERRKAAEKQKAQGAAYKTGGWTGLMDVAGADGDFQTVATAQSMVDAGTDRERKTKTWAREDYQNGLGYLAQSAASLKAYPIEERGALALQALEQTPYSEDPQVRAAIERAAADGRITDDELTAFEQQMMSAYERIQLENTDRQFDESVRQFDLGYGLDERRVGVAESEAAAAAAERKAAAKVGGNRPTKEDQNGVLRYLDGDKEPVFPDVKAAPAAPKPLIGSESMARVAAGLPTAKQAVAGIRSLVFDSKGTMLSQPGYDPGSDFGAGLIQDLGYFPLVGGAIRGATEPLSRVVGGADYQKFEDSYSAYEAAILPIMSGAAVTDTEALRQLRAVRIKSGDNKETKERKVKAMEMQVQGLEMAARGDVDGFLGLLDQAGEIAGTGPVARGGATAAAAPKPTGKVAPEFDGYTLDGDPITEDDIQTTMRENGMTREQVVATLMGESQ